MNDAAQTVRVLHLCNEIGLGGTERGIISMCRKMRSGVFDHSVFCLIRAGVRAGEISDVAQVHTAERTQAIGALRTLCAAEKFQVAIVHRAGGAEASWCEALRALRDTGIPLVIEINIFGLVDTSPEDDIIDCHLHISKSSYCRFRGFAEAAGYPRLARHRVLYIPIETERFGAAQEKQGVRAALRARLGLPPDALILLRIGRPDFRKWGDLLLQAMPRTLRRTSEACFVFLSAPASRAWYLNRRFSSRQVQVLPPTSDDGRLRDMYQAADIYVHSSRRGESYGASLVEAMAAGLPIVVDATPWHDNAQIEVVDHMRTGIIANSPAAFADAVAFLAGRPELRAEMGEQGRQKAHGHYDAEVVCRSLAALILAGLRARQIPVPASALDGADARPTPAEIEEYWNEEKNARERACWQDVAPRRLRHPLQRAFWGAVDAAEWLGRRIGAIG